MSPRRRKPVPGLLSSAAPEEAADGDFDDEAGPSKSAVKRELAAVQALALELIGLGGDALERLPLSETTRAALLAAGRLERRARQRQLRYASAQLAREDYRAVATALAALKRPHTDEVRHFHSVERWRDALLAGDSAVIDELGKRYIGLDRQQLMQLVRKAQAEQRAGRAPVAARQLFRYLAALREDE